MKSIAKHIKSGTYRPTLHARKLVVEPMNYLPEPPKNLPPEAHEIWRTITEDLIGRRIIAEKDLGALEMLVSTLHLVQVSYRDLATQGPTLSNKGRLYPNPNLRTWSGAQRMAAQLLREFGLSPLSGQRLDTPEDEGNGSPDDDLY